jgi:hypothetical protein
MNVKVQKAKSRSGSRQLILDLFADLLPLEAFGYRTSLGNNALPTTLARILLFLPEFYLSELLKLKFLEVFRLKPAYLVPLSTKLHGISKNQPVFLEIPQRLSEREKKWAMTQSRAIRIHVRRMALPLLF